MSEIEEYAASVGAPDHITRDLMRKVADDVISAMRRTLAIAPAPILPVAVSAATAAMGIVSALLEQVSAEGRVPGSEPDPDCVLLAGLLCARMGIGLGDSIGQAYADLRVLAAAPDLLEALRTARAFIVVVRGDYGPVLQEKADADLAKIDAALAKAQPQKE
jgi:hypothetical protein